RVDTPDYSLDEHLVLVERNELPQNLRRQLLEYQRAAGAVSRMRLVRCERVWVGGLSGSFQVLQGLFFRIPFHERLALSEAVGDGKVLLRLRSAGGFHGQNKIGWNEPRALVKQLVKGMLRIRSC